MKIKKLTAIVYDWYRFHLNIGGFTVKNCHWNSASGQVVFPRRYDPNGRRHRVVFAHGAQVNRLRNLLASGETALPRDRRPCELRIRFLGESRNEWPRWIVFNFTVRGFVVMGCRWQPQTGSIQLPVTFFFDGNPGTVGYRKKRVVCAFGAHINRLRQALEKQWYGLDEDTEAEAAATTVAAVD